MFRFTIRDVLWLTEVAAVALALIAVGQSGGRAACAARGGLAVR
jgi:hypothetical protein